MNAEFIQGKQPFSTGTVKMEYRNHNKKIGHLREVTLDIDNIQDRAATAIRTMGHVQ